MTAHAISPFDDMQRYISRYNDNFVVWTTNQVHLRKRLLDEGYRFDVQYNGDCERQKFVVKVNNADAIVWPSPCAWGKDGICYWGVFIKDDQGITVGREFPCYDPENSDAIPANEDELFQGLRELKQR